MKRLLFGILVLGSIVACQRPQQEAKEAKTEAVEEKKEAPLAGQEAMQKPEEGQQAPGAAVGGQQAANQYTVDGRVTEIEKDEIKLQTSEGTELSLDLSKNPTTPTGQPFLPDQIQEGAQVRASYAVENGENVVHQVEVIGAGQPIAPTAPAEPTTPDAGGSAPTTPP